MKKIFILVAAIAILASCGNKKGQEEVASVDEFTNIASQTTKDEHSAKNSLDYQGTYNGILPSGSGQGIETFITLTDSTYTKKITYIGKKNSTSEEKGTFSWNKAGNTISLNNAIPPNQYFVGENSLTQLDMDGNKIKGNLASNYILSK